jgi:hypothetical protein
MGHESEMAWLQNTIRAISHVAVASRTLKSVDPWCGFTVLFLLLVAFCGFAICIAPERSGDPLTETMLAAGIFPFLNPQRHPGHNLLSEEACGASCSKLYC